MLIEKRQYFKYIFLNCLTLGIYGFITAIKINKEVNALCKGDDEKPRYGYAGAWAISKFMPLIISIACAVIGAVVGFLICLLIGLVMLGFLAFFGDLGGFVFGGMLISGLFYGGVVGAVIGAVAGALLCKTYYEFWWYKQANRLHFNAHRFNLEVREKGTDTFLFRTAFSLLLSPLTIILRFFAWFIPCLILGLLSLTKSVVLIIIFAILFLIVYMLFSTELSGGAAMSTYFIIKNLNRFADVYRNGAKQFNSMDYEYYPSEDNKYPNYLPNWINGTSAMAAAPVADDVPLVEDDINTGVLSSVGQLIGINGACAGYKFDLTSGEEIIIGKDAKVSMVVIDPAYKEISRKHVGVCYDIIRDRYCVVDYSSNGTWANGSRLVPGQEVYLPRGTELKLANDKNTFRLG